MYTATRLAIAGARPHDAVTVLRIALKNLVDECGVAGAADVGRPGPASLLVMRSRTQRLLAQVPRDLHAVAFIIILVY